MSTQQVSCTYNTALYLRLSKDDEGAKESQSIKTQRGILQKYAQMQGLVIVDEYSDDGYSGTNFDRPAFQRMIADIEAGRINCVLTKDFSRLGRNSARGLDYIDEYFPAHGVRYISVTECYDSLHLTDGISMAAPMMMFVNEMYARDISNKIKSAFQIKIEKGEYVGSFAPYGYKKDIEHEQKNKLVIDWQVAHIVQEIFHMASEGCSPKQIAKYLNEKKVATPAVYRCLTRPYLNLDDYTKRKEWTSSMICKMLRNEVYLGKTIQGKTKKISFKSKGSRTVPREEWICVDGTHEPLVSEELYEMVRKRSVSRRCLPTKGFENIFSGIAKCADCGRNMTTAPSRKKGATYNLCCGGYKTYGAKECKNHFIDYDLLYKAVLNELRQWLYMSKEDKDLLVKELEEEEVCRQKEQSNNESTQAIFLKAEERKAEISRLMTKAYEDYTFGNISAFAHKKIMEEYERELVSIEQSMDGMRKHLKSETSLSNAYKEFFALLDEVTELRHLTKQMLIRLIDRIEVEQGVYQKNEAGTKVKKQKIRIYYRFIGCVAEEGKIS